MKRRWLLVPLVAVTALLSSESLADVIPFAVGPQEVSLPILGRDVYRVGMSYDTGTELLSWDIVQETRGGRTPGFSMSFFEPDVGPAATDGEWFPGTTSTDFGSFYRVTGSYKMGSADEIAELLSGSWYVYLVSYWSDQQAPLVPVPEAALSSFLALAFALLLGFATQSQPPDFVGKCQAAAAAKAGVEAAAVKVRGKYKGQDGRINLDFKLADGRVGVCRSRANADVEEVKLEEKAPAK